MNRKIFNRLYVEHMDAYEKLQALKELPAAPKIECLLERENEIVYYSIIVDLTEAFLKTKTINIENVRERIEKNQRMKATILPALEAERSIHSFIQKTSEIATYDAQNYILNLIIDLVEEDVIK